MGDNLLEIINGAMLPQFNGKKVSITGFVSNVNPNGLTFDIRATDDVVVKVNLRRPRRDALEGYVEVQGTAQGGNTVICDELIQFPPEGSEEFDAAGHNTLCTLLHTIPDLYKTSSS